MTYTPNRRTFLIAGGLTALASTSAFGANDGLRIGVIGAGGRMGQLLNSAENSGTPIRDSGGERRVRAAASRGEIPGGRGDCNDV